MKTARVTGVVLLSLASCAAAAAEGGPLDERFSLSFGGYLMTSDTNVRADSVDGIDIGTSINLEDTFGFDDENVFRLEGAWRFAKRHQLRLMYFDSQRTAHDSIETEIRFEDLVFPIGVDVTSKFDFEILQLAYQYAFLRGETYEIAASLGVHNVDFAVALTAVIESPGSSVSDTERADVRTQAPLPVVGLRGNWQFAGNFYLQAHAQYFQVKYQGYDGRLVDYQAGVLWQFSRHLGVGLSYNLFDTVVDIDDGTDFQGRLDWQYDGAQLYVRASF